MFERSRKGEHALLIQPHAGGPPDDGAAEEFTDLARSAGASIAALLTARIDRPNPSTLIGSGKLEEVKAAAEATGADLVLVNYPLSPGQERNLEKFLERRVLDRTGLILDIFAQRARSHEGKLQVELAQLKHMATRLVRGWTHLERQRGGSIGLRGPGETQLETDRRLLQKRVEQLQKRLEKVEVQRTQMRRARVRSELPRVALVGYTNAGKSTLFNTLTGAEAYAADQLFATLDPTVRRIELPGGGVVLADTVGFVRDLPHELVAAFRSTLSEAREADLLLHVIDAADPLREERITQVDEVLQAIGAGDIPQLLVFNKIDRIEGAEPRHDQPNEGHERVWISARDGAGLDVLKEALAQKLGLERIIGTVHLGERSARLRSRLHALGAVRGERHDETGWHLDLDMALADARRLAAEAGGHALETLLPEPVEDTF
ncbi:MULTISPECIES: ribosome rescue GTPase HflX [Pseudoxanthomonas]|jgi:GTPase|uniref:ribosome rescue GTPase HflX n=1 Tax=Pseudoxanthomonas TaxID=83618 RepID=UPI0011443A04|nr:MULTISPECIES: ribosome rescue GTPase HflX [Pseudoxanthomonas]MBB3275084.1 GTP-binding protein HflX [Pseudoxanthomonas sp. OG2]MBD9379146.1 GTPase HflX [Pseudoxanthomonas sp. PXM04]MBV7473824.1 GTPase HflX [Pseudoxanthomonas sp. PXM05]